MEWVRRPFGAFASPPALEVRVPSRPFQGGDKRAISRDSIAFRSSAGENQTCAVSPAFAAFKTRALILQLVLCPSWWQLRGWISPYPRELKRAPRSWHSPM